MKNNMYVMLSEHHRNIRGLLLVGVILIGGVWGCLPTPSLPATPLATPTPNLSEYKAEVQAQIERFETHRLSLEAHLNPGVQSETMTGRFLEVYGLASTNLQAEPFWIINTSIVITEVKVLEFTADRFKATACSKSTADEITPQGAFIRSLPPLEICGVYVFVREADTWKLAGYFNTADPRDWDYAPQWLKAIIGELPAN